jgi:signal transduction histidine kinase
VSFRTRLVVGAAYLLTVVVVALAVPLALNLERRAEAEFQASVFGNAALLAARVSDPVARAGARPREAAAADRIRQAVAGSPRRESERTVVVDAAGRVVADTSGTASEGALYATGERPEFAVALFEGRVDFRRRFSETLGEELLLVTVPVVDGQRVVGAVRMSSPTGTVAARVHRSWLRLALIGLAVVAAGLVLAWLLATSLARPLERLGRAAAGLGRGDLAARAPAEGPKEFRAVATTFNRMAVALAANLQAQRDFLANASHQLRTPLSGLKLRLEALKGEPGAPGEQAAKAEAELDRLSALVDDLLELARASSQDPTGHTVDLADAAREAVKRWQDPARQAGKHVRLGREAPAAVWADPADLAHILDNLVENALRYCPPGTEVTVEAARDDGVGSLVVSDTGPGIPAEERTRIFERFYRGSTGRAQGPGTGLGLAIVAELARRWDGDARLLDGSGTRIEATFPVAATDS